MAIKVSLNDISINSDEKLAAAVLKDSEQPNKRDYKIVIYGVKYADEVINKKFLANILMPYTTLNGTEDWKTFVEGLEIVCLVTFMEFLKKYYIEPQDNLTINIKYVYARALALRIFRLERLYQYAHYGPFNIADQLSDHTFLESSINHYMQKIDQPQLFSTGLSSVTGKMFLPVRGSVITREQMDINLACFDRFFGKFIRLPNMQYLANYAEELKIASGSRLFYMNKYTIDYSMNYYFYSYCSSVPKDSLSMDIKNAMYYYNLWARQSDNYCADIEQFTENIVNFLKMIGAKHTVADNMIHFKNPYYFTEGLDAHIMKIIKTEYSFEDTGTTIVINNSFTVHYGSALMLQPFAKESIDRSKAPLQVASTYVHPVLNATVPSSNWTKNLMAKCSENDPLKTVQIINYIKKVTENDQTGNGQTSKVNFKDIYTPDMSDAAYEDMIRKIYHTRHLEKNDPVFAATMAKCINSLHLVKRSIMVPAISTSTVPAAETSNDTVTKEVVDLEELTEDESKNVPAKNAPAKDVVPEKQALVQSESSDEEEVAEAIVSINKPANTSVPTTAAVADKKTTKLLDAPLSPVPETKPKRGRPRNAITTPKRGLENAKSTATKKRK